MSDEPIVLTINQFNQQYKKLYKNPGKRVLIINKRNHSIIGSFRIESLTDGYSEVLEFKFKKHD